MPERMFPTIAQRPVPLVARADLDCQEMVLRGVRVRVVKDRLALRYYHLQPEQYLVLDLLDGQRSLEDLRNEIQRRFPGIPVSLHDIQTLLVDLHRKGLAYSLRTGQGEISLHNRRQAIAGRWLEVLSNPFFIQLPGWNPDQFLNSLNRYVGWIFSWPAIVICLMLIAASWLQLAAQFDELRLRLPEFHQFFGWPNLLLLWLTLGFAKILHEIGHGLACKRAGCNCHAIGVALLIFSPTLYCNANDAWMLASKWKRIGVSAAGMYVEIMLSSLAIWVWSLTRPGLLHHLCLNLFFVSTVTTVIFNMNPLLRFDGYYMLSDWLEIANLRAKSQAVLQRLAAWCCGWQLSTDPLSPQSGQWWFATYAVLSSLYGWVVMVGICLAIYSGLKSYQLESLGISWVAFTIFGVVLSMSIGAKRMMAMPHNEEKSYWRRNVTAMVGLSVLCGACLFPLPIYLHAPFYLQPRGIEFVFVTVPGRLTMSHVKPGEPVKAGDVLATLHNEELEEQLAKLQREKSALEASLIVYHLLAEHEDYFVTLEKLDQNRDRLADLQRQLDQLVIRAPIGGIVVSAPRKLSPKLDVYRDQLATWSANPLAPFNRGCQLDESAALCGIAPANEFEAILLIDQHDRNDVRPGQVVHLKCENLPHRTLVGHIAEISQRYLEFAPRFLSVKLGGQLTTVSDTRGRERLTSQVYQVAVRFDDVPVVHRYAMRGEARCLIVKRSALAWLWRYCRQTFLFRL